MNKIGLEQARDLVGALLKEASDDLLSVNETNDTIKSAKTETLVLLALQALEGIEKISEQLNKLKE